jgi:hypothetical protein
LDTQQSHYYQSNLLGCSPLDFDYGEQNPTGACHVSGTTSILFSYMNFTECYGIGEGSPFVFDNDTIWGCQGLIVVNCRSGGFGIVQLAETGHISCANFYGFKSDKGMAAILVESLNKLILTGCSFIDSGTPVVAYSEESVTLIDCRFSGPIPDGTWILSSSALIQIAATFVIDAVLGTADCPVPPHAATVSDVLNASARFPFTSLAGVTNPSMTSLGQAGSNLIDPSGEIARSAESPSLTPFSQDRYSQPEGVAAPLLTGTANADEGKGAIISAGSIAGIAAGALAFLALVILIIRLVARRGLAKENSSSEEPSEQIIPTEDLTYVPGSMQFLTQETPVSFDGVPDGDDVHDELS